MMLRNKYENAVKEHTGDFLFFIFLFFYMNFQILYRKILDLWSRVFVNFVFKNYIYDQIYICGVIRERFCIEMNLTFISFFTFMLCDTISALIFTLRYIYVHPSRWELVLYCAYFAKFFLSFFVEKESTMNFDLIIPLLYDILFIINEAKWIPTFK